MRPHKIKFTDTTGKPQKSKGFEGMAFRIQAISYTSNNPSHHVTVFDKDGDECMYPIPGQLIPKIVPVEHVSVILPITIVDEGLHNDVIIFGEKYRQE